jgi:adenine-specific DNA-methyltransferase
MTDMPEYPESLDLKSASISEDRIQQLKQVVPEAFTENGYIDIEKLKTALGEHVDEQEERFGLQWPGKRDCFKVIQEPAKGTLQPAPEESEDWDNTKNLFIEGDNLEVLKLLQKSYYGKVKMIYIDPPYNTGNEFIYPDDYKENLNTYLAYTGQVNEEGYKFSTNTETEGRYHSNWLNMMYPRLFMARNLLKDDGVIFISIDDHEVANLRSACNEIFGEENFLATICWQKKYTRSNDAKAFSTTHEYILAFTKNSADFQIGLLPRDEEQNKSYRNPDTDSRGPWKATPLTVKTASESYIYPITLPSGRTVYPPKGRSWMYSKEAFEEDKKAGNIWFGKDGDNIPAKKSFLSEVKKGVVPITLWDYKFAGHNHEANNEAKALGFEGYFDNPKPTKLIKQLIQVSGAKDDDILLDFFSGSSSTADSTLQLNRQDSQNRRFIMVQLPEPIKESSEAFKEGYTNIADISKERIKRVIKKTKEDPNKNGHSNQEGLFPKEEAKDQTVNVTDLGFRVFKLDQSNFKEWEGSAKDQPVEEQLKLNVDHVRSGSSEEQMLYEILLKSGYPLTVPIDTLELANKKVYSIVDSTMLICLEDALNEAVIIAMAEKKPNKVVVLDKGFNGQDELKTNAVQIMKSHGVEDFRTV